MNSKEEFTIQMKMKVAEIEEILKRYLPEAEGSWRQWSTV